MLHHLERGTMHMITFHNGRHHIILSRIWTCDPCMLVPSVTLLIELEDLLHTTSNGISWYYHKTSTLKAMWHTEMTHEVKLMPRSQIKDVNRTQIILSYHRPLLKNTANISISLKPLPFLVHFRKLCLTWSTVLLKYVTSTFIPMSFRERIIFKEISKIKIGHAIWYSLCNIQNVKLQVTQSEDPKQGQCTLIQILTWKVI